MDLQTDRVAAQENQKLDARIPTISPIVIELRDVVKIYESAAGKFAALNGVNLKIRTGEFVAVIGKSGSGKTTLMNMITGIDRPTIGEVVIAGTAIHTLSEGATAVWRGNTIGVVFQFFQLLPTLTVMENVMLPMDFCHRFSLRERRQRALYLLHQVDLIEYANRLPSALSGGQQQRVAIARALANDPPILIADEPTGNLDSSTAASVFSLFEQLVAQGKTIVMVTHDQDLVRQVIRTIYIKDGRITGDQTRAVDGSTNGVIDPKVEAYQRLVSKILDDPVNTAAKLRSTLQDVLKNQEDREVLYQAIYEEVKFKADQAERAGNVSSARKLWAILIDATSK